jgi:hypothetical protein
MKKLVYDLVNEHYGTIRPTLTHAEIEKGIEAFMTKVPIYLLRPD